MPTPNHVAHLPEPVPIAGHATCPPENGQPEAQQSPFDPNDEDSFPPLSASSSRTVNPAHLVRSQSFRSSFSSSDFSADGLLSPRSPRHRGSDAAPFGTRLRHDSMAESMRSPSAIEAGSEESDSREMAVDSPVAAVPSPLATSDYLGAEALSAGNGFPNRRYQTPYLSSLLRSGSTFKGQQTSEKATYDVEVNIKHVDLKEWFLCGYLHIEGLTKENPKLTTYFEGEIIGPKYGFRTKHESWGSSEKTDMQHWDQFPAWRPLSRVAKKSSYVHKDCSQKENIFMRWKEVFLVPDHNVKAIEGASFEGFYYICFNQVNGVITGLYFHQKTDRFQRLELHHVRDKGCMPSIEFR